MDIYSRKIVGWAIDKTMTKELVLSALKMAYKRQNLRKGVIHHSDRGVQYAPTNIKSYHYLNTLRSFIIPSESAVEKSMSIFLT